MFARRRGGLSFRLPRRQPSVPGAATRCRADAFTSRRTTTTVRWVQRTSLRLLSRMRATTFMHVVVPPPVVPAPAGPADKPPPRADVSFGGPRCVSSKVTPGLYRACGGDPPPDQSGTSCPSAACHQSLTPKLGCNRGAGRFIPLAVASRSHRATARGPTRACSSAARRAAAQSTVRHVLAAQPSFVRSSPRPCPRVCGSTIVLCRVESHPSPR